jgi:SAM-dependent methyltransferase
MTFGIPLRSMLRRKAGSDRPRQAAGESDLHALETKLLAQSAEMEALLRGFRTQSDELLKNQIRMQWRLLDQLEGQAQKPSILSCEICGYAGQASAFGVLESHCMFGGGRLLRHQCPSCDTIFGPQKMLALTPEELAQEYEMHYRLYPEGDSTANEIRAFHALQPKRDGLYLNYGAGAWSRSVEQLRADGWNVLAFEPHQSATRGDHVIASKVHLETLRFDGIFSNNVLEHFRHPVSALRDMAKLLTESGAMSHATPCFEYRYEFTRFHLFFFPGRSLNALATSAGLSVGQFEAEGEFMNAVLRRQ